MYAITFDFDTKSLEQLYPKDDWRSAYSEFRGYLQANGFEHKQGSVYFALEDIDAAECIAIVQEFADEHDWFVPSLSDIRMLRIDENNDLMTVLDRKRRRRFPVIRGPSS